MTSGPPPDGENNREQGEQVQRQIRHGQHQEEGADQRQRDRHDGNQDGPERSHEKKDHYGDDRDRLRERLNHVVDGVLNVFRQSYGMARCIPVGSSRSMSGSAARTLLMTSKALAVGPT